MLLDIVQTFCMNTGYDPNQLAPILNYINRGAKDLYNALEADALLRETVLVVPSGTQISLPPWIGELRGLREYGWSNTVPINEIGVPRFSSDTQKYRWRNWTLKGKEPLANAIINASVIILTSFAVEQIPAQVTISGRSANSQAISETVSLTSVVDGVVTATTTNSFAQISSIISTSVRQYDIFVSDVSGNPLAKLYNNEQKTEYIICDVSQYYWLAQVGDGATTLMEVLYKTKFYKFANLTDEFPAAGYDDAIAYKAIALWAINQEGREALALQMNEFAKGVIDSNVSNAEKGQVLKISFQKNSTYDLHAKFMTVLNWRRGCWNRMYW